jgi:hypothetical protein
VVSKFAKSANMTPIIIFFLNISKNAEFHVDFESVEQVVKNAPNKSYKQNKFANFRQVFANNFFWVYFFKTFLTDSKSV